MPAANIIRIASWIGLFCAIISAGVLAMFTTYLVISGKVENMTVWVLSLMVLVSAAAGWAAVTRRALLLLGLFIISFLPVGLYLAWVPSWVRFAGFAQLGFLLAALMMLASKNK